jgi:hypothetical protein
MKRPLFEAACSLRLCGRGFTPPDFCLVWACRDRLPRRSANSTNASCGGLRSCCLSASRPTRPCRADLIPKKWGPRLGPGAPEGASQMPVSFSHRRVGSSILASLSEAGGQRSTQIASKPLPPRLQSVQFVYCYAPTPSSMHGAHQPKQRPILYKMLIFLEID